MTSDKTTTDNSRYIAIRYATCDKLGLCHDLRLRELRISRA